MSISQLISVTDDTGLCSQEPGSSKTGVQFSSEIGIELDLGIDANIGDDTKPSFSTNLAVSHQMKALVIMGHLY